MKRIQLTKLRWLLLCLTISVGAGNVWGQTTDTYTFTSKAWAATLNGANANWTSGKDGNQLSSGRGVQVTTAASGANATSPTSFTNVSQVVVTYSTNISSGAGSVAIQIGSNTAQSQTVTKTGGTTDRTLTYNFSPTQTGVVKITVTCTTNSIYVKSIAITYGSSSTTSTTTRFPQSSYSASYPGTFAAPTATVKAGSTTVTSPAVTYSSSNTSVATVNSSTGAVTIAGVGTTTITANYAGNSTYAASSASYTLTVGDGRTATSLSFPQSTYEAVVGQSFTSPIATLSPSTAGSVTYSSSNTSVATVNSTTGIVTIVAAGSTVITATFAETATYKGSTTSYTLVVSEGSSSSTTGFQLYTGTLTEGDYVIYYDGKAMKASVSSNRLGYTEVTPTDNVIETTDASLIWHIAPSGSYWTIYNAGVSQYAASNGTKNQAQLLASGTDDKSLWTVSGSNTYEFVNKQNSSNNVNANLRNNGTYGFACYSTSTGGALSLYRYTSSETPTTVNAPTLTADFTFFPATTETNVTRTITIAPTTEGSYVRYTTDGTDPTTSSGTLITSSTNVTISGTTTVKAIAYFTDDVKSSIVSATYTLGQTVNSIAAFKELTVGTEARLYLSPEQNARVLHYNGSEIYLRDNSGAICLYLDSSLQKTIPAHDYHVAGWIIGKYQPYNGLPEMMATSNTTTAYLAFAAPVTETPTEPVAINPNDFDNYKADWVTITDLRAESNNNVTDDAGNTFKVYNKYGLNADSYYQDLYDYALVDLTGLAVPFGTDLQIVPIYYNNVRPIVYVIDENKDFTSPGNDIRNVTVRLVRTLSASNWNTFAIPFDIPDFNGRVRKYEHAEGTTMVFVDDYIEAGKPYLVKPDENIVNPVFTNVTLSATPPQNVEEGGYSFNAIYSPTNIYSADRTNRFLKSDGYLYYPTDEDAGRLKGMRAYFVVPAGASNVKVNPDGTLTFIDDVQGSDSDGQGTIYDLSGRRVGNDLRSLPRGLYIVNGKKVYVQ